MGGEREEEVEGDGEKGDMFPKLKNTCNHLPVKYYSTNETTLSKTTQWSKTLNYKFFRYLEKMKF